MRVLITGGSGFIGRHLFPVLQEKGHITRILDLEPPKAPSLDYFKGDIRSPSSLSRALQGMDAVVHLAALISVEDSLRRPAEYFNTNVTGTINVMKACVERGVRRFVHISSAAVYGEPFELPLKETSPTNYFFPNSIKFSNLFHFFFLYSLSFPLSNLKYPKMVCDL